MLDALSGGDATKWAYFEAMNVIEFLGLCVYYKDKQDEEIKQRRLQELKNR